MNSTCKKIDIYNDYPFITEVERKSKSNKEIFNEYSLLIQGDDLHKIVTKDFFSGYKENLSGIYFLFKDDGKLLYVGKSTKLRERLRIHVKGNDRYTGNFSFLIKYIKIIIYRENELHALETSFIEEFKPMFNGGKAGSYSTGQFYKYKNLREKLDKLKDKKEIIEDIKTWNKCFIDRLDCQNELKNSNMKTEVVELFPDKNEKPKNEFLEAIKESIKLAVKHESEEKADKIIYGFLSGLSK
jgi:hypothetical protein